MFRLEGVDFHENSFSDSMADDSDHANSVFVAFPPSRYGTFFYATEGIATLTANLIAEHDVLFFVDNHRIGSAEICDHSDLLPTISPAPTAVAQSQ